jgi:hypothetical protein
MLFAVITPALITEAFAERFKNSRKRVFKAEISRRLSVDPETAAKYYGMSEEEYRAYAWNTRIGAIASIDTGTRSFGKQLQFDFWGISDAERPGALHFRITYKTPIIERNYELSSNNSG